MVYCSQWRNEDYQYQFRKSEYRSNLVCFLGTKEIYHTITFDANGGSVDLGSKLVTVGEVYGDLPVPIRNGYIFNGWYTAANGGTKITHESIVDSTFVQTLFACWRGNTYIVSFDANGGSVDLGSKSVTFGETYGDLRCYTNKISELDVSQNPKLTELNSGYNPINSLDISKNPALTYLGCYNNNLSNLDVRQNPVLEYLDCRDTNITSLDISQNPLLTTFEHDADVTIIN